MNRVGSEIQTPLTWNYRKDGPVKTLWHLFSTRRMHLVLVVIFYAIKQSPVWMLPIVTGNIITHTGEIYAAHHGGAPADPAAVGSILFNSLVMLVLIAQNIPMHTLYATCLSSAVRHVQLLLRSALVIRLQQLSMSFHDSVQSGRLQSKVLRDVEAVETLSRMVIENLLQSAIVLTVAVVITLHKRPSVTLFFLITIPAAVVLIRAFQKPIERRNEQFRREVEDMSARVSEMIEMIPITRAHGIEQTEVERLHRQLLRIRHSGQKLDFTNHLFGSTSWAVFQSFQLLCLLFNIWQCTHGRVTVGDVVMYQGFFGMVLGSVQGLVSVLPQLSLGIESMRSIGEVLESPDIEANEGKASVKSVRGQFKFDAVSFTYPGAAKPALTDFSLDVQAGECLAVVGESGSGKTTLMSLIIGFRRPTSGRMLVDGVDTAGIDFRTFRRFLAVVPQQTVLFSGTVRENITYGLSSVTDARLREAMEMANCADFVDKLPKGTETIIGSHGGKLSGGQRQRIAIARALLRDPRVLIFDEATSALDLESESLVQQAINRLIKGRTTFIVAHRLSTIRNADRVLVMKDGLIHELGTHEDLLGRSDSAFARMYALQERGIVQ